MKPDFKISLSGIDRTPALRRILSRIIGSVQYHMVSSACRRYSNGYILFPVFGWNPESVSMDKNGRRWTQETIAAPALKKGVETDILESMYGKYGIFKG